MSNKPISFEHPLLRSLTGERKDITRMFLDAISKTEKDNPHYSNLITGKTIAGKQLETIPLQSMKDDIDQLNKYQDISNAMKRLLEEMSQKKK